MGTAPDPAIVVYRCVGIDDRAIADFSRSIDDGPRHNGDPAAQGSGAGYHRVRADSIDEFETHLRNLSKKP